MFDEISRTDFHIMGWTFTDLWLQTVQHWAKVTINLFDLVAQSDKNKHYNLYIFVKICKMVIQLHISSIVSLIHLVAVKPYWHMKGQNPSVISPEFRCFVTVYYLGFFKRLFCCSCYTFFYSCAAYLFIQTSHIYWSLDFFFNGNCQTVKSYITIIQIFLHLKRNL